MNLLGERFFLERQNLLHVAKLCIKELVDKAISLGRTMDEDSSQLQHFFTVLDHGLCNGLRLTNRGALQIFNNNSQFPDPWAVLERLSRIDSQAADLIITVRGMAELRNGLSRSRAFIRLAFMQKKLAEYMRALVHERERLRLNELYLPGALLLEEEGLVFCGLLSGINVIDCNFHIKEQISILEEPLGTVNYSAYMKKNYEEVGVREDMSPDDKETTLTNLLDQKNYLEELCVNLTKTNETQISRLSALDKENCDIKSYLHEVEGQLNTLREQNQLLTAEKNSLASEYERLNSLSAADMAAERETYQQSRCGLDVLARNAQVQLREETQLRLDVEKELQTQIAMKAEIEMALRLLEKDIHEKQDTIVTLRRQVEEVKTINLDLYEKLKRKQEEMNHNQIVLEQCESKHRDACKTIFTLEERLRQALAEKGAAEETARRVGQALAAKDSVAAALETDVRVEREWRSSLQVALQQLEEEHSSLRSQLASALAKQQEMTRLATERDEAAERVAEQERALTEMAVRLSRAELQRSDMAEQRAAMEGAEWADDRIAVDCSKCQRAFSVARRKHHCRQCGKIYCAECSDNRMPLVSHSKPVRVCDACHTLLLQRYTSRTS